eukprot:TRINITY_DN3386_c0_g1_i1.p1 TRINITY_DN3386_c0_g1~~TRINITY_DN3386_c0_g1_i1.p1  ORF type:complete len:226 (-),score=50.98 TRINITY_DN3386_c0_g1_i1:82-759(-)
MGGSVSTNIVRHIQEESNRVMKVPKDKKETRDMVLDEIIQIQPLREHPIDLTHLGTLFVLDKNLDGKFSVQECIDFAELCCSREFHKAHDFQTQVQAYCTMLMWKEVGKEKGDAVFVDWFVKLFTENMKTHHFKDYPGITFLNRDTIKTLHEILNIRVQYGMDYQSFFDLMQRVGEEQNLMSLEDEQLDDVVPSDVIKQFAHNFIKGGFIALMLELGFDPDIDVD